MNLIGNINRLFSTKWGFLFHLIKINAREYRWGNQKWTRQRNWQHRVTKTKYKQNKNTTQYVGHHSTQTNTNNVNKTWALLQTTAGKNEPNIVFMRKYRSDELIHWWWVESNRSVISGELQTMTQLTKNIQPHYQVLFFMLYRCVSNNVF